MSCLFTAHVMHSGETGKGPFPDNTLVVNVRGDEIVSLVETLGVRDADVVESMWVPFTAWIEITHPEDVDLLDDVESAEMDSPAFDRSLRLWEQRTREYADAILAGEVE